MGSAFDLPDVSAPTMVSRWLLTTDEGRPAMAVLGRATLEMYMLLDKKIGKPEDRYQWLRDLHMIVQADITNKGYTDGHVWCQSERFGRRLMQLGWTRPLWPNFHFKVE
jgi:hypothetical protein